MKSVESRDFESALQRKIVGQDEAVQAVVDLYQVFRAGLNSPGRPVGNLLFPGPTGAGKTRVVEATAEVLFGDPRAVIKVDCAEFRRLSPKVCRSTGRCGRGVRKIYMRRLEKGDCRPLYFAEGIFGMQMPLRDKKTSAPAATWQG
ncbi:MAG: hypothetical protein ACREQC_17220 [Candidatus Binataceae bacterium]